MSVNCGFSKHFPVLIGETVYTQTISCSETSIQFIGSGKFAERIFSDIQRTFTSSH